MIYDDLKLSDIDKSQYNTQDLVTLYIKYIELLERRITCEIDSLKVSDASSQVQYNELYKEFSNFKDTLSGVKENLKDLIHNIELNQKDTDNAQTLLIKNIEWKLMVIGGGSSGAVLILTELLKVALPVIFNHIILK